MRRLLLGALASASLLSACDEGCSDELKIAIEVYLTLPEGVSVDKVTAELNEEQVCSSFRPDKEQPPPETIAAARAPGIAGWCYVILGFLTVHVRIHHGPNSAHQQKTPKLAEASG